MKIGVTCWYKDRMESTIIEYNELDIIKSIILEDTSIIHAAYYNLNQKTLLVNSYGFSIKKS